RTRNSCQSEPLPDVPYTIVRPSSANARIESATVPSDASVLGSSRTWLGRERGLRIQDCLVLQAGILEKEVAAALLERRAVLRIVPQLGETLADALALRNL